MPKYDPQPRHGPLTYLIPELEGRLPALLDEVGERLREYWPDYARFLTESRHEVNGAAAAFVHSLVALAHQDLSYRPAGSSDYGAGPVTSGPRAAEGPPAGNRPGVPGVPGVPPAASLGGQPAPGAWGEPEEGPQDAMFEEIGRLQWRQGRELTTLLSAYQVGARVAWHHVSSTALEVGVEPAGLAALAEAVFVFVDRLSSASVRGYVREQSEAAVTRERLREEVAELLLSDRSDSVAVRAAATRAGWPLPKEAAVVLVEPSNEVGQHLLARLPWPCLSVRRSGLLGAIVPDPAGPGRRQRLATVLHGGQAVVGHPVALGSLPASLRIAEVAAELRRAGLLTQDPVFVEEHLDAIIVHRDPRLLQALRRQCLAPLAGLAPAVQERLAETLASWLWHMGDRRAVAAELHIHPQTVRYRLGQLREHFGAALEDPASRVRLTLVLAWGSPAAESGAG
jgi:PucR C-terminal helix-turn-helix domain/GGDEF-like domain